jgi:hypothetical protein
MIHDPLFYLLAIPAVILTGVFKGGFGTGLGILAVPLMALAVPPVQAAGILLPVLCLMDLFGLWAYRRHWHGPILRVALPAALVGILAGTATFRLLDQSTIRLLIGGIAVTFALHHWLVRGKPALEPGLDWRRKASGGFWSAVSGFTSFVAHAGGPPFAVFLLPQGLDPRRFVGTTVVFFGAVNYAKLIPYAWLGQLSGANLATALVLSPLAPLSMGMGIWLNQRIRLAAFYRIAYGMVFLAGLKLLYDGSALWLPWF